MSASVIILAAGSGRRVGLDRNKLLLPFMGATALYHSLQVPLKLKKEGTVGQIIVASSARDFEEISALCTPLGCEVVLGGETRGQSVYNSLKAVTGEIVAVHDGARPFATKAQYEACFALCKKTGSGVLAMPATDTVCIENDGCIGNIPPRTQVYALQTPQVFNTKELREAYDKAACDGETYTDDSAVYSRYIKSASLCKQGAAANRKLTFLRDFEGELPKVSLQNGSVGFGADVHAFGKKQDFVTLGGVRIPCDSGLVAHSDGDVIFHAVMDALLSACGLRDIGHYFPENDPAYEGADSARLLAETVKMIGERGFETAGLAVAVQAEKPRLKNYIEQIRDNLCAVTGADKERVAVTAGTCEGLGFVGAGLGICVYCTAVAREKEK